MEVRLHILRRVD